MIQSMFNGGAMPVLERVTEFTSARHRLLTNNIANLDTPYFKPKDLDVEGFREALGRAIDERRELPNANTSPLGRPQTEDVTFAETGIAEIRPEALNENLLFHDRNNRDLDRTMQRLVENVMAHRTAVRLLRSEHAMLNTAISERV